MKLLSISAEQMSQQLQKINRVSCDRLVVSGVLQHRLLQTTRTVAANNKRGKCGNIKSVRTEGLTQRQKGPLELS